MNETTAPARTERADSVANRARILTAARAVYARRGLNAEVREIAEEAHVGVGTLYRHFANREELLVSLLEQTMTDALAGLQAAVAEPDPRDAVRAVLDAMAESHQQFGSLFDAMHDARLMALCKSKRDFHDFSAPIAGLLSRGIYRGAFRADLDIPVTVAMFNSAINIFSVLHSEHSYREIAHATADLFLAAIEA